MANNASFGQQQQPSSAAPETSSESPTKIGRAHLWFDRAVVQRAVVDAFAKLHPATLRKNPVIFVVEVGAALVTVLLPRNVGTNAQVLGFEVQIALWLWLTVLFANFAEAMAEARGKAQADMLRKTKTDSIAKRLLQKGRVETVAASKLRAGDVVVAQSGDLIPGDGEVIEGIATVDESVITGESAPVIRESGGDRSAVTGGTRILSDYVKVRITSNAGETFLDKMIALVEGTERQKTPNEVALTIFLTGLTLIFLLVVATLHPFANYAVRSTGAGSTPSVAVLVSLLVCLIPTTIGGLISAIGIAGMDRVVRHNVLAMNGRAVEAAGDVHTLLLDKTGTVTLGNREAVEFIPFPGVAESDLADAAQLSSLADETPEGRSVVVLAKEKHQLRGREVSEHEAQFIPFSAYTRMSGVNIDGRMLRKGASGAIAHFVKEAGGTLPDTFDEISEKIARRGGTPLAVADGPRALGVIYLKDIMKGGMMERVAQLRAMGIRSVLITGDNPLTAAAIATEAGVDDFLAQATPADKLAYIKREQAAGRLVAMTGDGTNDAPALAQADVGVAMNTGTVAAKEAGNMVDLDSNPTKLIEIVAIGKQLLITRGALTTFSVASDVAKYFAIIPAMFLSIYPVLGRLNIMRLHSPESAVLAAVIFNALAIAALLPLTLRGVKYRAMSAAAMLRRNMLIYGLGGLIVPFAGIWIFGPAARASASCLGLSGTSGGENLCGEQGMLQQFLPALRMLIFFTIVTGLVYPGIVTGLCQLVFSRQANGSLITENGRVVGSSLIGQRFSRPEYFHGRPSAAGRDGYDATASGGSNLGPTSRQLSERVKTDAAHFREENPEHEGPIPADAITASGSGLDPDISLANAMAQVPRVAKARGIDEADVLSFIHSAARGRDLAFLGETRVNVLELNVKLDDVMRSVRH